MLIVCPRRVVREIDLGMLHAVMRIEAGPRERLYVVPHRLLAARPSEEVVRHNGRDPMLHQLAQIVDGETPRDGVGPARCGAGMALIQEPSKRPHSATRLGRHLN